MALFTGHLQVVSYSTFLSWGSWLFHILTCTNDWNRCRRMLGCYCGQVGILSLPTATACCECAVWFSKWRWALILCCPHSQTMQRSPLVWGLIPRPCSAHCWSDTAKCVNQSSCSVTDLHIVIPSPPCAGRTPTVTQTPDFSIRLAKVRVLVIMLCL